jgi:hypothetical protein
MENDFGLLQTLPHNSEKRITLPSYGICALGQQANACLHAYHTFGAPRVWM